MSLAISWAERGLIPDSLLRFGIRGLLRRRLQRERKRLPNPQEPLHEARDRFGQGPLAVHTDAANEQHYEVPARFFELALGPQLKYSSCYYQAPSDDLATAEQAMLDLTMQRAELANGQRILELGCGWGSLTLAMARRFPEAQITAVSNSAPQRRFIEERCAQHSITNVTVITQDLRTFDIDQHFDRIVSVECFEHMRNYHELLRRIAGWLGENGRCFIHVFCHRDLAYPFEDEGRGDWMARHFFTGGTMPAFDLFSQFDDNLHCLQQWAVDGTHYARTSRHWLENMDRNRQEIIELFRADLGPAQARIQFNRWRMFFMACEECFGFRHGQEWLVGHYLFTHSSLAAQTGVQI
ncbi:MAG: class I SAM-dependent methyltransferase [Planctomycetota bacterium]|nr:MAG: class I SAM-dependent methyltransferase [Planctomycetota bacterium]